MNIIVNNDFAFNYVKRDKDHLVHIVTHVDVRQCKQLSSVVSPNASTVLTSQFIASFLSKEFGFERCVVFPYNKQIDYTITNGEDKKYSLYFFDSKHSAGSFGVLLEGSIGTAMYTGQFIYYEDFWTLPFISKFLDGNSVLNTLYFDSSYYELESNCLGWETNIEKIVSIIQENKERKVFIGADLYTMEPVICELAYRLNERIHIHQMRNKALFDLGYGKYFTNDRKTTRVFIVDGCVKVKENSSQDIKIMLHRQPETSTVFLKHESIEPNNLYIFNFYSHSTHAECYKFLRKLKPERLIHLQCPVVDHSKFLTPINSFLHHKKSSLLNIPGPSLMHASDETASTGESSSKLMNLDIQDSDCKIIGTFTMPNDQRTPIRIRTPFEINELFEKSVQKFQSSYALPKAFSKCKNAKSQVERSALPVNFLQPKSTTVTDKERSNTIVKDSAKENNFGNNDGNNLKQVSITNESVASSNSLHILPTLISDNNIETNAKQRNINRRENVSSSNADIGKTTKQGTSTSGPDEINIVAVSSVANEVKEKRSDKEPVPAQKQITRASVSTANNSASPPPSQECDLNLQTPSSSHQNPVLSPIFKGFTNDHVREAHLKYRNYILDRKFASLNKRRKPKVTRKSLPWRMRVQPEVTDENSELGKRYGNHLMIRRSMGVLPQIKYKTDCDKQKKKKKNSPRNWRI